MKKFLFLNAFVSLLVVSNALQNINETNRGGKALSVFQVVRFPNIGCVGSSSLNGTCYTASECSNKAGTSAGSCASGFGVCCTFTLGCGSTIAENCSYFQSSSTQPAGQCSVQICKCSSDICQLRLDFNNFVITGPSTLTTSQIVTLNGAAITGVAAPVASTFATRCLTDTFSVTGNGQSPPVICGINTGYHMYVDSSNNCNTLMFQLGPTGIGTTAATRSWNIKISQISCFSQWLAPQGCTQYYTGTAGQFNSYNYAGGTQLADQQQQICFRRERGYCRLCVTPSTSLINTDFSISNAIGTGNAGFSCCGYGGLGVGVVGYDCLVIPGAVNVIAGAVSQGGNNFCGKYLNNAATGGVVGLTICTSQTPFTLQFLTDAYTFFASPIHAKSGFRLNWFETTC